MSTLLDLEHLKLAYQHLNEPVALVNQDGQWLYENDVCRQWLLRTFRIEPPKNLSSLALLSQSDELNQAQLLSIASEQHWQGLVSVKHPQPQCPKLQLNASCVGTISGDRCILLQFSPPSLDLKDGETLAQMAYKDSLTGLANRTLFDQLFDHEISQSQRLGLRFAVLFIDLDRFKLVNDNLGHDAGDVVLCSIAQRLEKSLRKSDVVARLGGDEFVVILNNIKDSETVAKVTEKLIREIKKPVKSGSNIMQVGCSVGISVYPDNGEHAETLMQHADVAMYRAKHQGGNHYYYFSDALNQELQDMRLVEKQVLEGVKLKQFIPHFQPLIDVRNGDLVGIECLARWNHPQRGLLGAMEFIPVATKMGAIQSVLGSVLEQAFQYMQRWQQLGCQVPLSINIASSQFYQPQTFEQISSLLTQYQIAKNKIRLEVTESTLQESGAGLVEQLKKVNMAGFSITLDDFGTGYSSLRYLQQLPVDILKIDRSFVRNLDNNPHDKIIVKAIIQLAQTLGIEAVAEGVENQLQSDFLSSNDCHLMQGFLFSQAISGDDFSQYISSKASPQDALCC